MCDFKSQEVISPNNLKILLKFWPYLFDRKTDFEINEAGCEYIEQNPQSKNPKILSRRVSS